MSTNGVKFGYYPRSLEIQIGSIIIESLVDLADTIRQIENDQGVERDWIYAPPQQVYQMGGGVKTSPYPSRIFGLPKTHIFIHTASPTPEHTRFLLWALSFFTGMRLSSDETAFLDATPIKPGTLVDFNLTNSALERSIDLAEAFWLSSLAAPKKAQIWSAAVHALFLGQNPLSLQFERFMMLYASFDACFHLARMSSQEKVKLTHHQRLSWMCEKFEMPIPDWASSVSGPAVVLLRNAAIHEALFMDKPLGFAVHGTGTSRNLTLEMEAMLCRLLVALLGGTDDEYVKSPVGSQQRYGLNLKKRPKSS